MKNRLLPLPYKLTDSVKSYISDTIQTQLKDQPEVIFITHEAPYWNAWMISKMAAAGYHAVTLQPNLYSVIIFKQ